MIAACARHPRHAFTLIELLLATSISVILMAALVTVTGHVARDRHALQRMRDVNDETFVTNNALQLIATDLRHARRVWPLKSGGILMTGYGGIDRDTLRPDGSLVRIAYAVVGGDLVRLQQPIDGAKRWVEPVLRQVRSFEISWNRRKPSSLLLSQVDQRPLAIPVADERVFEPRVADSPMPTRDPGANRQADSEPAGEPAPERFDVKISLASPSQAPVGKTLVIR
jgi:prepilin-type N-terminal cleavage/methylation domain-containing protein